MAIKGANGNGAPIFNFVHPAYNNPPIHAHNNDHISCSNDNTRPNSAYNFTSPNPSPPCVTIENNAKQNPIITLKSKWLHNGSFAIQSQLKKSTAKQPSTRFGMMK